MARRASAPATLAGASMFRSGQASALLAPSLGRASATPSRRSPRAAAPRVRGVFSYAGPRRLSDILKTELLADKSAVEISALWTAYHDKKDNVHGLTLNAAQGKSVLSRAAQW